MKRGKGDEAVMQCPRCAVALHKHASARAVIDTCGECAGSFFDEGEMLKVLGRSADPEVWARANRKKTPCASELSCPRCAVRMHMHPLAHEQDGEAIDVDVDFCPGCGGIWLDGGEVDAVMQIGARNLGRDAKARSKARGGAAEDDDDSADSGPEMLKQYLSLFPKPK